MFHRLQAFLLALTAAERDGRLVISLTSASPRVVSLKYLLLNPEEVFRDVVDEARAVVLAGGTMAPVRSALPSLCP
jgi:chromosome transmission fidelity protein 1